MIYKNRFEDFFFETTASTLDYMISTGGQVIFQGRAVKSPAKPVLRINVGQRVRDYLENEMPDFRDFDGVVVPHPDALLDFELQDVFGNPLETYRVLLDYTEDFTGADMILSDPVNGHTDPRQKIFWASFNTTERDITIEIARNLELYFDVDMPYWIPESGGTFNIHYTANTDFTFSYTGDWFTAVLSGDTIVITATENETEDERSGSICFTYNGIDFTQNTLCYDVMQDISNNRWLTFDIISGGTIVYNYGTDKSLPIYYTFDSGATWNSGSTNNAYGNYVINVSEGQSVMFKRNGSYADSSGTFSGSTAVFNAKYNPLSLYINFNKSFNFTSMFKGTNVVDASELVMPKRTIITNIQASVYKEMFADCKMLVSAPELPAENLPIVSFGEQGTYYRMFKGCTALVNAPSVLPATAATMGAYCEMFMDCTSLVNPPEIKAETADGESFQNMFRRCTSLVNAPEMYITTIVNTYFGTFSDMFRGCTSLTNAPELPATVVYSRCYERMFAGCTSLVAAPALPAETLGYACYLGMFINCTSLVNAPELPAQTLETDCYNSMFSGCTNLSSIKCLAENNVSAATESWVYGVSANGTFTKKSGVSWNTGINGIPNGWTVVSV